MDCHGWQTNGELFFRDSRDQGVSFPRSLGEVAFYPRLEMHKLSIFIFGKLMHQVSPRSIFLFPMQDLTVFCEGQCFKTSTVCVCAAERIGVDERCSMFWRQFGWAVCSTNTNRYHDCKICWRKCFRHVFNAPAAETLFQETCTKNGKASDRHRYFFRRLRVSRWIRGTQFHASRLRPGRSSDRQRETLLKSRNRLMSSSVSSSKRLFW